MNPRYFGLHDIGIGPVAGGGRPALRALLVNGRVVVEHDAVAGLDMAELGSAARDAVARLRQSLETAFSLAIGVRPAP